MRKENGFRIGLCMLTVGITLGYMIAKLMDKLDCHIVCVSGGSKKPRFFRSNFNCDDDYDDISSDPDSVNDCHEDTNEPEPYNEPLDNTATDHDEA